MAKKDKDKSKKEDKRVPPPPPEDDPLLSSGTEDSRPPPQSKADKKKAEKLAKEEEKRAKKAEKLAKEAEKKAKKEAEKLAKKGSSASKRTPEELEAGRRDSIELARLAKEEELYFKKVKKGDVREVETFLGEHGGLNLNCENFCGVRALHLAIENKDLAMTEFLLRYQGMQVADAAQQAVDTGDSDFAAKVLDIIKDIRDADHEMHGSDESADYSPLVTPLVLAAQNGDYKMVRMLIERGHDLSRPHAPDCLCPDCKKTIREFGPSMAQKRLNVYKAVSNPAFICHVTDDPILYCFQVDKEMEECSQMDKEFRAEYVELGAEIRDFPVQLLTQCRDNSEVERLLKVPFGFEDVSQFPRLQLALDHRQKEFVAHSLVQQVLTAHWLGEFRSWPRLSIFAKALHCFIRLLVLPFMCLALIVVPWLKPLKKYHAPLNRFLLHLVSYLVFLTIVFLLNLLETGKYHRGPPQTGCEALIIIFVVGHIWATIRQLWIEGGKRFLTTLWNWYDVAMEVVFVLTFVFWLISYLDVMDDQEHKRKPLDRKFWKSNDATLLHEGFFVVASVLAFGKLAYFCLQSSRLGPLQVSMGKMLLQIAYFLVLGLMIMTAFSIPLTRMYAYYDGMKQTDKDGNEKIQTAAFSTLGSSFITLFWAMLGMSPTEAADVVVENLNEDPKEPVLNSHDFTQGVGRGLFAVYELIMIIALVNTLIAVLSNTFQNVVDNADVEFKFARAKLWIRFFDNSTLLPPPFNLFPTANFFANCTTFFRALAKNVKGGKAKFSFWRCCYVEYEKEKEVDIADYQALMRTLVQRYFRSKQTEEEEEEE